VSAKIPYYKLSISLLNRKHEIYSFNSTSGELNDFLKSDAFSDQDNLISKTYICLYENFIAGFFTLTADTIEIKAVNEFDSIDNYEYRKYPAVKLARLAVDSKFERKGVGRFLLLAAIGKTLSICNSIGCRYITVDSKPESVDFYKKHGFILVEKSKNRDFVHMYLNMYKIIKSLEPTETLDVW